MCRLYGARLDRGFRSTVGREAVAPTAAMAGSIAALVRLKAMLIVLHWLQNMKGRVKVGLPIIVGGDFINRPFLRRPRNNHF